MSPWRDSGAWWRKEAEAYREKRERLGDGHKWAHRHMPKIMIVCDVLAAIAVHWWHRWLGTHHGGSG